MDIQAMLDQLAEFEAQRDLLTAQKEDLIGAVKVPAEVEAVQAESLKRKRALDAEYQAKQLELACQKQAALATVVIPPEVQAIFEAINRQRTEIEKQFTHDLGEAWAAIGERKEKVDQDLREATAGLFEQIDQRKAEINAEFAGKEQAVTENIARLTKEIKTAVTEEGKTVKGKYWQAVYVRGRVTWNTDMLDGMIIAMPELAKARKVGEPSVTLRRV